jgi:putative transcriptional regulator
MLLNLERVEFLLAQYVAGALPEPAHVLMGSHVEMRTHAARFANTLEDLAGQAIEAGDPVALKDRDRHLHSILGSAPRRTTSAPPPHAGEGLPTLLRAYARNDLADIPWKTKLPGLREHVIETSSTVEARLLWARPGRALPRHRHQGLELTLVLEGEFQDHRGSFAEGEVSVADEDIRHRPVVGALRPCICFSVLFAPIAFSGSALRLFGDLMGI